MKEGAWIEATTGQWHWIDDHADWIRRPERARSAGLPEDEVQRLASMPRRRACGEERNAIILEAMKQGLIRFRGHGAEVTFETTMPLESAIHAVTPFMAKHLGPLTSVRFNRLPDGPCVVWVYQDLTRALDVVVPHAAVLQVLHPDQFPRSQTRGGFPRPLSRVPAWSSDALGARSRSHASSRLH